MPPRASWTGYLKLSLVAIPVRMYNAISSASNVTKAQRHPQQDQCSDLTKLVHHSASERFLKELDSC